MSRARFRRSIHLRDDSGRRKAGSDASDRADASLVLHRGDEAAFRRLYARHTPRMYALAVRLLGHRGDRAEDVIQEAWMRSLERLNDFRWESRLGTWLTGIVINCCRERRDDRETLVADVESVSREVALPMDVRRVDLERALFTLPEGYRTALVLHDIEGYTHEEIAGLLGVDIGTSKSQLSRARRAMRQRLTTPPSQE